MLREMFETKVLERGVITSCLGGLQLNRRKKSDVLITKRRYSANRGPENKEKIVNH